jgi:hypothetical protein
MTYRIPFCLFLGALLNVNLLPGCSNQWELTEAFLYLLCTEYYLEWSMQVVRLFVDTSCRRYMASRYQSSTSFGLHYTGSESQKKKGSVGLQLVGTVMDCSRRQTVSFAQLVSKISTTSCSPVPSVSRYGTRCWGCSGLIRRWLQQMTLSSHGGYACAK